MNTDLEFHAYQPGQEESILELFRHSYGHDLGRDVWRWRFQDNPAGPGVIDLCWSGDVLAAHYAVTSIRMRIEGTDWLTGLSGTTMTHPNYRGRGLFPILARRTYARMAENNVALAWGFPNAMSHRGFINDLAWADIYEVPTLRLALTERLRLPTPDNNVIQCEAFDGRFDLLWDQVKDAFQVITCRDRQHLQWRYTDNPTERYQVIAYQNRDSILAYVVFKRYRNELQIVDLLTSQGAEPLLQLIARVVGVAREESASAVSLWLGVTHPFHHGLEKVGFVLGEPITYFGGLALQPTLRRSSLLDFRNWYLTMGDSDVF